MKPYYPLDLSALAYPLMRSRKAQSNFRFSAHLDAPIDPALLKKSAEFVLEYYPNLRSKIVKGAFWHKLVPNDAPLIIKEDDRSPLSPFRKEDTNGYPFRLAYKGEELVFEIFHAVTDGKGSILFLSDLLSTYVAYYEGRTPTIPSHGLKLEDAFLANARRDGKRKLSIKNYNGKSVLSLGEKEKYLSHPRFLPASVDIPRLKEKAAAVGATLTEYVFAAYIYAVVQEKGYPLKKPIALFLPVDLRRFFPSDTLQNFVSFERIRLEKEGADVSFEGIVQEVKKQFKEKLTEEKMQEHIDDTVRAFTLLPVRAMPLFLKLPLFKLVKKLLEKVRQTAIISNVGVFTLPPEATEHVKNVELFLNISHNTPINVSMLSYNGKCNVNITLGLQDSTIPKRFFEILLG